MARMKQRKQEHITFLVINKWQKLSERVNGSVSPNMQAMRGTVCVCVCVCVCVGVGGWVVLPDIM